MAMTNEEARLRAMELWGSYGTARLDPKLGCVVGTIGASPAHRAYGFGPTWEAAFAEADARGSRSGIEAGKGEA